MNKTALFLICLIAPIAFAQEDILNMLDRTPEGKEVLNHLFVQTKLMGGDLDINTLKTFLKANRDNIANEQKAEEARLKTRVDECHADKKSAKDLAHEHVERELALRRQLAQVKRTQKRSETQSERAVEELNNYKKFEGFVSTNKKAWTDFYKTHQENHKTVEGIFHQILENTKQVHQGTAFVELPANYATNMAQIRMQVESSDVDFNGMGPVVSNLMEIMQNHEAIKKPEVAVAVRSLVQSLIENIRDHQEALEEENEHQSALFEHLEKAFQENVSRSEKEVEGIKAVEANLNKRVITLTAAADHAHDLITKVDFIVSKRAEECRHYKSGSGDAAIRHDKINAIISQLEEILITKSQGLKSYFLQREMRKN